MNVQKVIFMVNETYGDVFAYLPKENEFKRNINSTCQNNKELQFLKNVVIPSAILKTKLSEYKQDLIIVNPKTNKFYRIFSGHVKIHNIK